MYPSESAHVPPGRWCWRWGLFTSHVASIMSCAATSGDHTCSDEHSAGPPSPRPLVSSGLTWHLHPSAFKGHRGGYFCRLLRSCLVRQWRTTLDAIPAPHHFAPHHTTPDAAPHHTTPHPTPVPGRSPPEPPCPTPSAGAVLGAYSILKEDNFPGMQSSKIAQTIPGASNFRCGAWRLWC